MTLILADPNLGLSSAGHHLSYSRAVVEAAARRGLNARCVGHRAASAAGTLGLAVEPLFEYALFTLLGRGQTPDLTESFVFFNTRAAAAFSTLLAGCGPDDTLFLPSITHQELFGLALALAATPAPQRPRIRICLRYHWQRDPAAARDYYREALQALSDPALRVALFSDTTELAAYYATLTPCPIAVLPIPARIAPTAVPDSPPVGPPIVGYLGEPRSNKGFFFLPPLVTAVPALHWRVQIAAPFALPPDYRACVEALRGQPGVSLIDHDLDEAAYLALLGQCDIILIAYRPDDYRLASSGIFTEALAAAKVVVIPADTWMAREADRARAGAVCFSGYDAVSVIPALQSAAATLPRLRDQARACAPAWHDHHNPDRLVACVLEDVS
ncbi:MAG: hypothetical protein P4M00_03595 [Azospirillaceae bacterium]|nr:hypothetical protein [Azospirillaceae bacterium]